MAEKMIFKNPNEVVAYLDEGAYKDALTLSGKKSPTSKVVG